MNEARYREAERRMWASVGAEPTERRVRLAGAGLEVRVQEVGDGPAIMFVHGASTAGTSWAPLVGRLRGFRSVVLDRPGCGLSERVATRFDDVKRRAEFGDALVVELLDALGLDRAHVVATSFGGYAALRTAAAHPGRVDRLVEFGWAVGVPVKQVPLVMRLASVPWLGRLLTAMPPTERAVRMMLRNIGLRAALESGRFTQEGVDWFLSLLRDTDTMRNELDAGPRLITLRGMNDSILLPEALLSRIEAPTLFVWGEDDPLGGAEIARQFVAHLPNAELTLLPGVGHAPWMDDPDHAAKITTEFLTRA